MEPLNADKALARNEHLPRVTNPRPAKDMDDLAQALEDWETSKRLYAEADGVTPGPNQERMAFVNPLPGDISSNVLMHLDMPGYKTYEAIKKYALKLVKVMQSKRRIAKAGVNLVGDYAGSQSEEGDYRSEAGSNEQEEIYRHR